MKIGVLVGKTEAGKFEYLGAPGDMSELIALQREIKDNGMKVKIGKSSKQLVKTWLANVAASPLKTRSV